MKIYIVCTGWNCLVNTVPMSTHNVCFHQEVTQQTHVATTSLQHRCNVTTLQQRYNNVVVTLCVYWEEKYQYPLAVYKAMSNVLALSSNSTNLALLEVESKFKTAFILQ